MNDALDEDDTNDLSDEGEEHTMDLPDGMMLLLDPCFDFDVDKYENTKEDKKILRKASYKSKNDKSKNWKCRGNVVPDWFLSSEVQSYLQSIIKGNIHLWEGRNDQQMKDIKATQKIHLEILKKEKKLQRLNQKDKLKQLQQQEANATILYPVTEILGICGDEDEKHQYYPDLDRVDSIVIYKPNQQYTLHGLLV